MSLPEDLVVDLESAIHQHMGHDGQSDETNDWVTDLLSAISPLIERVLADEIDRLRLIANAAGQGWKAATDEAEKAHEEIEGFKRTVNNLAGQLREGDLQRERQRQEIADLKRWTYLYAGASPAELRDRLKVQARHSEAIGASSVCVDLPTGDDLLVLLTLLSQATTRSPAPETPDPDRSPPG